MAIRSTELAGSMNQRYWVAVMALQGMLEGFGPAARLERGRSEGVRYGRCDDFAFGGRAKSEGEELVRFRMK